MPRGRKPCAVTPARVRDLRASSNRITWKQIGMKLNIGESTARKLWARLPESQKRLFKPKSTRPKWLRRGLLKDPILNRNLCGDSGNGMKVCQFKDVAKTKRWACQKSLPISSFHKASLTGNGIYLRSLCKKCERKREDANNSLAKRIILLLMPKLAKLKRPRGRPAKVTKYQIDFLVAKGMTDQQISKHCKVSYSTAKRLRLKDSGNTGSGAAPMASDWSKAERYKK